MDTLQSTFKTTSGWCLSLVSKIVHVTPLTTFTIQSASFAAQILLLLTFFLPLKILILLGSDVTPGYFPLYLKSIKKTHLIAGLSALTLSCYLLYILCEFVIYRYSKRGATKLVKKSEKLNLFNNQNQISTQIYSKFNRGLSAGIFSSIALSILLYIYPLFFIAIISYLVIATLLIIQTFNKSQHIRNMLSTHKNTVLNTIASVGFLVIFFFMVVNFLYFEPPKILAALISLLLMRQILSRLTLMFQDVISLRAQHRQVNALFFYGQQLSTETTIPTIKIRNLLGEKSRNTWLLNSLKSLNPEYKYLNSIIWHQTGFSEIYAFEITASSREDAPSTRFLIKLFSENLSSSAEQEATIIHANPNIPCLNFIGSTKVEGLPCHIFELEKLKKIERHTLQTNALSTNKLLISIPPSEKLVLKFSRSHLYLEQRLHRVFFDQLKIIASPQQTHIIDKLISKYNSIIELLSSLPRQIICPDINLETLLISENGDIRVSHWANWKMEPVGSNWPITHRAELANAIIEAKKTRADLEGIAPAAFIVCALTYTLERFCTRANYVDAIALLPDLLDQLESAENFTSNGANTP